MKKYYGLKHGNGIYLVLTGIFLMIILNIVSRRVHEVSKRIK
jgi:hypothetical protein